MLGAAALVIVASKSSTVQHSDRHVTQVASSATDSNETARSGYIIASS
jgi:hypothetical protein